MQSWGVWLVLFSSGVRHLLGSCLPRFLLFLGSVVSRVYVISYSCLFVLVCESVDPPVVQFSLAYFSLVVIHPPVGVGGVAVLPHLLLFHFLSF